LHRLPVPTGILAADAPVLPGDAAKHLKVVRPRPGEEIELFDGAGRTRRYAYRDGALAACGEVRVHPPRPFRITLFACVTKGSRWDWTVEKATELGIARIVPVISDRCIVRLDSEADRAAKRDRWARVALDAARQSDAVWLPEVVAPVDFAGARALVRKTGRVFAGALTEPPPRPILAALAACTETDLGVFVGPEGDFTPEELQALLDEKTVEPVSFGPTVLRAETAALFGVAALVAHATAR